MDDDDLRRGKPTNHKVFGEGIAVLAGDALLTEAFALVAKAKPPKRYPASMLVRELAYAAGSLRLIAGRCRTSKARATTSASKKSNARISTRPPRSSPRRSDSARWPETPPAAQLKRLTRYGQDLGLAFQVIDDILDATSTKEIMGKSVRADQKNQKSTFPSVLGIDKSRQYAADLIADAQAQLPFGKSPTPSRHRRFLFDETTLATSSHRCSQVKSVPIRGHLWQNQPCNSSAGAGSPRLPTTTASFSASFLSSPCSPRVRARRRRCDWAGRRLG